MVTNAIQNILNENPIGFRDYYTGFASQIYPIYSNSLGGIVLFNKELEENAENYQNIPQDNSVIGYANRSVNSTTDNKRGSYNSTESGAITNGYKYVYDFSTTQANGLISALALTSNAAGSKFLGDNLSQNKNQMKRIYSSYQTYGASQTNPWTTQESLNAKAHNSIRGIDIDKEIAYSIYYNGTNFILNIIDFPLNTLSFMQNLNNARGREIITTTSITPANGFSTQNAFFPDDYEHPSYIWGFSWGSSSSSTTIKWIKISLNDYSFEEGSWILEIPLYFCGDDYSSYYNTLYPFTSSYWYSYENCLLYENYLYCFDRNLTGVYKISINNPTEDVIFMRHPEGVCHSADKFAMNTGHGPNTSFNVNNGVIYFANGYILNDTIKSVLKLSSPSSAGYDQNYNYGLAHCNPCVKYKDFIFSFYCDGISSNTSTVYYYQGVFLQSHYLATINNLENPIEKTDDKTMKITYVLTEVDEETPLEEETPET